MAKRQRRKLTAEELGQLQGWAIIRLPMEHMAVLLGISKDTLDNMYKKDAAVRTAIDTGQARSSGNVRNTLYMMAMGKQAKTQKVKNEDGKEQVVVVEPAKEPDFNAMKFWCQTQEGFTTKDKLELTGADGKPLGADVAEDELERRTERILARIAARRHVTHPG